VTTFTMQLSTRLRTWALVAGLTGLLIALGALIGGSFLWLFVALAVAINLAGYYYSDRLALRAAHAQPLSTAEAPELFAIARDLSDRARIPLPRLYVMPGEQANAFAAGRDPEHAAVAMTRGLLTDLAPNQVRGVLAHEFAHVTNRDILVSSLAAMVAGAISAVASILQLSFLFGSQDEDSPLSSLGSLAAMILAPIGAVLLQMGISRQREYLADATAADLLGTGAPLADALETVHASNRPALDINPATAPMYIINPLSSQALTNLFSTHPPVPQRVQRLRAYRQPASTTPARTPTGLRDPDGRLASTRESAARHSAVLNRRTDATVPGEAWA
jgi:heat shock protein HtpX